MKKLLLILISFAWFAGISNATSYAIPEGATPIDCIIQGTVTEAEDDGYQMQKLALNITSTKLALGQIEPAWVADICKLTQVSDMKYLYSSCDTIEECVVIAGGDGPKLAK